MTRHPEVSVRKPQSITCASAIVSREDIINFIENTAKYFEEHNLMHVLDDPNAFGNGDETAYEVNAAPRKVLAMKGSKNVYRVESGRSKESFTVFHTILASGIALRPQEKLRVRQKIV